jgi:hypothetical protein
MILSGLTRSSKNFFKTAVILSLDAYNELLEDLSDLAAVAERRDEPTIPLSELMDGRKSMASYNIDTSRYRSIGRYSAS